METNLVNQHIRDRSPYTEIGVCILYRRSLGLFNALGTAIQGCVESGEKDFQVLLIQSYLKIRIQLNINVLFTVLHCLKNIVNIFLINFADFLNKIIEEIFENFRNLSQKSSWVHFFFDSLTD